MYLIFLVNPPEPLHFYLFIYFFPCVAAFESVFLYQLGTLVASPEPVLVAWVTETPQL